MTEQMPLWLAEKVAASSDEARERTCPRCGERTLCARAGRVASLDVVADAEPIGPLDEIRALLEGRLTWHLIARLTLPPRIAWRDRFHIEAGPARHPVLRDHHCEGDTR